MDYGFIRVIVSVLTFVVTISIAIAGWLAFKKITSNHLHHLDVDIKELKKDVKSNTTNISKIQTDIAVIATRLECTSED